MVAWRKGLKAGVISFVATWTLLLLLVQMVLLPWAIPPTPTAERTLILLLTPLELVIGDQGDPLSRGLTILSGILLHAAIWSIVFAWSCRKREG